MFLTVLVSTAMKFRLLKIGNLTFNLQCLHFTLNKINELLLIIKKFDEARTGGREEKL